MQAFVQFLGSNPYILLFLTIGLAVWVGKFSIKGYGLGAVAAAIVVGCLVATVGAAYGVKFHLDEFAKSLLYYLFMYGVGLRVGPSFVNALNKESINYAILAIIAPILGLAIVVLGTQFFGLPLGAAGGMLAGSQTMSAAIGSAEQAVSAGVLSLGSESPEEISAMIALSYGITYIWGTVGIILLCKYLPRIWGVDAKAAALEFEKAHGVPNVDDAGLTAFHPFDLRAYRVENPESIGKTVQQFRTRFPQYQVVNVERGDQLLGPSAETVLQQGDVVALGGRLEEMTANMGVLGPEVPDARALNIPLDQAEILVTNKEVTGRPLKTFRGSELAGQIQLQRVERSGVPLPIGLETTLQKRDVLFVTGLQPAVSKAGEIFGVIARHSSATDLLTLSFGMILGFLIGLIEVPAFGAKVGLGNAGGLLLSGIIVSSISSRLRFFGNTPNAARNILEDLGLIGFVAIVGINAGADLLTQLTGAIALKIFIVGFLASTIPPIIVWAIGFHIMKINPALLMGATAGARSHSGPAREAAKEVGSSVPWLGFPVGYAVSGVLLTVFGYFAMVLAH
ncbi:aspartate:alanine exchanger family transporter [Bordetella bronchiseptica]|uniref:Permease membrane region n=2 Tax=Bordetella bronchiseptica TaxID=518 RepID=A0ABR4RHS1_BORBO|nr:TrkA C-terminal domain-containing protein [Bordetella bronchiseptica]SHS79257.1 putative transporter [Mycobacteroides abscessus subsp. abscessus]AWP75292.1 transporter [Bordetella bronchiseptica]AZW22060.1 transporter [Bordetella bronchiseptica]KCV36031.1 putative permease membrane region [Bordetella bronchiseptica 00-P-2796]KDC01133.1 putative permease membrane region [Bordetella bronchiseptica E010]